MEKMDKELIMHHENFQNDDKKHTLTTKGKINFHTHSTFCDGKNEPEEMIQTAIKKGFTVLGFSSHSIYPFAETWHICPNEHRNYVEKIRKLADKYQNQIKILCGFEADFLPPYSQIRENQFKVFEPDYLIGAVHYVSNQNGWLTVDDSAENVQKGIQEVFKGDGKACICEYFETQRKMISAGKFNILAHPDLPRKRNGILHFFDETETWYKEQITETVRTIAKTDLVVEINTGAIARGVMDDVYPAQLFLEKLFAAKVPVCINSDCHNAPQLDTAFDRAQTIAKKIGYKELVYPTFKEDFIVKL